jgi:hypothetical protein
MRARAACRACSSRGDRRGREQPELGHEQPVALDLAVGQLEAVLEDGVDGVQRLGVGGRDPGEAGAEVGERVVEDDVHTVLLGFEVVVEGGRADADVGRDVGPFRGLVAVATETLRRRGEDLGALGALDARPPSGCLI